MTQESLLGVEGQPAPYLPGIGSNPVDRTAPIATLRRNVRGEAAQPSPKRIEGLSERNVIARDRERNSPADPPAATVHAGTSHKLDLDAVGP